MAAQENLEFDITNVFTSWCWRWSFFFSGKSLHMFSACEILQILLCLCCRFWVKGLTAFSHSFLLMSPVSNFQQMTAIPDFLVTKPIKVKILCVLESWNEMLHYDHAPNPGLCSFTMTLHWNFCHRIQWRGFQTLMRSLCSMAPKQ